MGQSFILFYRKDSYFVKKSSNGRDFYEYKCSLSGSGATTPPQNFQAGDAPQEAGDPQKETHSLLPPGLICHRVTPDRSLFLAGLRPVSYTHLTLPTIA